MQPRMTWAVDQTNTKVTARFVRTFSATDSMQAESPGCLLRLSLVKYETSGEVNPAADRMLSISCIVRMKTTCPDDK